MSDTPNADRLIEKKLKEDFAEWVHAKPGLSDQVKKFVMRDDPEVEDAIFVFISKEFKGILLVGISVKGKPYWGLYRYSRSGVKPLKKQKATRNQEDMYQWGSYWALDFE